MGGDLDSCHPGNKRKWAASSWKPLRYFPPHPLIWPFLHGKYGCNGNNSFEMAARVSAGLGRPWPGTKRAKIQGKMWQNSDRPEPQKAMSRNRIPCKVSAGSILLPAPFSVSGPHPPTMQLATSTGNHHPASSGIGAAPARLPR